MKPPNHSMGLVKEVATNKKPKKYGSDGWVQAQVTMTLGVRIIRWQLSLERKVVHGMRRDGKHGRQLPIFPMGQKECPKPQHHSGNIDLSRTLTILFFFFSFFFFTIRGFNKLS
jgi:hypothetical protein